MFRDQLLPASTKHPVRRFPTGSATTVLLVICLSGIQTVAADESTPIEPPYTADIEYSEVVDGGFLFVDGGYIPGPHTVEATKAGITVNDIPVSFEHDPKGEDDANSQTGWGGRNRGWWGQRRRPQSAERTPADLARRLYFSLSEGNTVVTFAGTPMVVLSTGGDCYELYNGLLSDNPTSEERKAFIGLARNSAAAPIWDQWLNSFEPTPQLRTHLQKYVDESDAVIEELASASAAKYRMETFAYPLTLAGMMLGVFAFGHMLKWTGRNLVAEQSGSSTPESTRCAEIALLLMLGMSVVDLLWTILAGQAGVMKEINPLAAGLIHTPMSLAAFKVTATGLGCGLLYVYRERRRVQEATWWMCLVCVLVTFRWVMFDSMTTS